MKQFFKFMLASMVAIFLSGTILFLFVIGLAASGDKSYKAKPNTVLKMKLNAPIQERSSNNPFEQFNWMSGTMEESAGLNDILAAIEEAKENENVIGIYLDLSIIPAGIATITEVRDALVDFKESGKWIYCYSEFYMQRTYYLASVADKIFMNPEGMVDMRGLYAEVTFLKNTFEKIGVEPQIIRHGKFKSAIEPLVREDMSEANKVQTIAYVQSIWDHILADVAEGRGLTVDELNAIADEVKSRDAEDALELGLIDQIAYKDEVLEALTELTGAEDHMDIEVASIGDLESIHSEGYSKDKIAVIYAQGEIGSGEGDEYSIGSERISKAIRKAREDDKVKAIVLRVNSPGGSSLASDVIWREVVLATQVKPVVASMGDLAASGGYYISCAADTIIANRNTITGSIGVFGTYMNAQELLEDKLGLRFDGVGTNEHANFPGGNRPMNDFELELVQEMVEDVYNDFITRVADGRGMEVADVDSIGQGRVWTGAHGIENGLVDELGSFNYSIEVAAAMAGLEEYRVYELPEQKDPLQELLSEFGMSAKTKVVKEELGPLYPVFEEVKKLERLQGIQMRMEQDIYIH
jgi:protease-4